MRIVIDTNVLLARLRSSIGASFAIAELIDQRRVIFMLIDSDDDMLLEFAVAAQVDYLVTHNVKDFLPSSLDFGLRVATPSEFLRAFRAINSP